MNSPHARLPSIAPAYIRLTNTPIHFGVTARSAASAGASTAGAADVSAVNTWIARVATSATCAVRAAAPPIYAGVGASRLPGARRTGVAIASTTRSCAAAGTCGTSCASKAPAMRAASGASSASSRS